jgi:glycerol-3-phosphate acyltransferase PlsY
MLKGAAAVFLAGQVAGLSLHSTADATIILPLLKISAGVLAVAGHNWSLFLKFKGGKGVATSCGVFLMLTPVPTTMALAVFIIVLVTSRYVSVASMTAALSLPAAIYWRIQGDERLMLLAISLFMAILIIIRHRSNLVRLFHGEEPKIDRKVDDT